MYDLIILGGGPAALAAAMYALRKGINFVVISPDLGGKAYQGLSIPGVESHRALRPQAVVQDYLNQLSYLTHTYIRARATSVTYADDHCSVATISSDASETVYNARFILIATGVTPRSIGAPGERDFAGRGLGYSSISYSHLLHGKRVFLIGDSRRTVNDARELAVHAEEVLLFFRFSGRYHDVHLRELQAVSNIRLVDGDRVIRFNGDKFARSIVMANADGVETEYAADAFFVQLQPAPNSILAQDIVDLDDDGRIIVDMRNRTTAPRIYAAGDVTNIGFEQILVALGEGTKAALAVYEELTRVPIS